MTRIAMISLALLLSAPAAAQDKSAPEAADAPTPKMESLLQNCDAHKFETTVESTVNGKPHRSKVKMCGNEGQSDADWIGTLKDAIAKLEVNKQMAESTRNQIIGAIKVEIVRLEGQGSSTVDARLPPGRSVDASDSLSDDYSVLPPLKASPPPPPPHVLAPPTQSTVAANDSTPVAPSPEPVAAAPSAPVVAPPAAPPAPLPAKPRLAFSCISPEYPGGGPCVIISRDTMLSVKAAEAVASGVSLRFVRQGDARAELALGSMRKGQSLRFALPQPVCSGVVSGEVTIDVIQGGRVVDRQGPSLLRC